MKKKIIFAIATGLFAVTTVFNMNLLQSNNTGDISLDAIAVMAQANEESSNKPNECGNLLDYTCYEFVNKFACLHMSEVVTPRYNCKN